MSVDGEIPRALGLRTGDWVEVRTEREILSTLDEHGIEVAGQALREGPAEPVYEDEHYCVYRIGGER